jgi:2-phosphosulfolactate phosphatase
MDYFSQGQSAVCLEWGLSAVDNLGQDVACIVIVDVLSFSTCVNVAVERGALIYPYPSKDESAIRYALSLGASVTSSKRRVSEGYSLSPHSLMTIPAGLKLVMPSPNGSAAAYGAKDLGAAVYAGCLRNMRATAAACRTYPSVLVVPCGERWSDGTLRPSIEDYIAAGGIVAALNNPRMSPEARAASVSYLALDEKRREVLEGSVSSLELVERGFGNDVRFSLEEDASAIACKLDGDHFIAAVAAPAA